LASPDDDKSNQTKPSTPAAPKVEPDDTQMKKAIELLRDKRAS